MHACIHAPILTRTRSHTRVILHFLPPNIDFTNSNAHEIARPVNLQGWWTIGSLTKPELGMQTFELTRFMYLLNLGFMASSIACSGILTQTRASTTLSKARRRFSEAIWSTEHRAHKRHKGPLQDAHPGSYFSFCFLVQSHKQVFFRYL